MQAYIGGIVPLSTVDWPTNVCTAIFFSGCDFRCGYCHNKEFVGFNDELLKDLKDIKKEILKNSGFIDAIIFSGGEPCLQRQALLTLARFAKKQGLKVGIETNGSKPYSIKSLINENLLDFIALDIKAPLRKEIFEKVTQSKTFFRATEDVIENIKQTLDILKGNQDKIQIEIRTTIVPGLIFRKEDVLGIAKDINGLNCRWVLQPFKSDKGTLDQKMSNIKSPTKKFLEDLKKVCQKKYSNLRMNIRV
ncbi:MAG: anaerobic ribonucleoside-triphosphate reductase activating protein [Nanoarchaeota archaeon]|nr:anaerobic ribonucleoside-triphosphate reductase activating protein [Nanoarchaeota archaeon]